VSPIATREPVAVFSVTLSGLMGMVRIQFKTGVQLD